MRSVSAREANQQFVGILVEAAGGEEIVITRRGQPVAVLASGRRTALTAPQEAASARVVEMMRRGLVHDGRRFRRDQMHGR